jgi:cell filamentation protein, protein adenylyltransferase
MAVPPFRITPAVLALCAEIERALGRCEGLGGTLPEPRLRRENRIRTIQGTVAIEGNSLSTEQITAILEHKRVIGPRSEITEVENAIAAYDLVPELNPFSSKDLLRAHGVMMKNLVADAGRFRRKNVGVIHGSRVGHVAPPAHRVAGLMQELFRFLKRDETTMIVKACVFHYELEFIHPFSDGNGRLGRLWQHALLLSHSPVFAHVPTESLIKQRQAQYYTALGDSDRVGDSTEFLQFSLEAIRESLSDFIGAFRPIRPTATERLNQAASHFAMRTFSRKDYLALHAGISTATASRDLQNGVREKRLQIDGSKATARYRFARRR